MTALCSGEDVGGRLALWQGRRRPPSRCSEDNDPLRALARDAHCPSRGDEDAHSRLAQRPQGCLSRSRGRPQLPHTGVVIVPYINSIELLNSIPR
ncbi:uncharacterized protein LOC122006251 isoform X3 [Zingiber officinale]|uniref:uncharacterized protein LOC122006251 isoform X3 n=1 Tax=Zingiber officinale TaxID=94328 RepID=UPI001C4CE553|nr:uncharacterized protein LOC122006251 isoform X3 [Zingiber officinale]